MMFLAQADNAGKNSMWDTWDGVKFYVRPYDMDTQCGLNNRGLYVIPPSAEINPQQSPRIIRITANTVNGTVSNYDESSKWLNDSNHARYSTYTTSTSRFWNLFYNIFKSDINKMYAKLRSCGVYSKDYVIKFFKNITSNIIGESFYNYDMRSKYLSRADDTKYNANVDFLPLIMGNRIDQFTDWLSKRIIFCDTYFNYQNDNDINNLNTVGTFRTNATGKSIGISVYSPMYIKVTTGSDSNELTTFIDTDSCFYDSMGVKHNGIKFLLPLEANDKENHIYGLGNIRNIEYINTLDPTELTIGNARKLTDLDVSNCSALTILNLENAKYLRNLKIIGCTRLTSTINLKNAQNLETFRMENSSVSSVTLCPGSPLDEFVTVNTGIKTMEFNGLRKLRKINIGDTANESNNIKDLSVIGCPLITSLDLTHYRSLETLTIQNCDSLHSIFVNGLDTIKNLNITGCKKLRIFNASNSSSEYLSKFDISSIPSIEILDITESKPTNGVKIKVASNNRLKYLYANNSTLSRICVGQEDLDKNDGLLNMINLTNITTLCISNCVNIKQINNLNMNLKYATNADHDYNLFYGCQQLESINNSSIHTGTIFKSSSTSLFFNSLFYNCKKIKDISTFRIINDMSNNINTTLNYSLAYAKTSKDILKTVIDYTRIPEFEKCTENFETIKSKINSNKYLNQKYFVKDNAPLINYTEFTGFVKNNSNPISTIISNINLFNNDRLDKSLYIKINYGRNVSVTKDQLIKNNQYISINKINCIQAQSISSIKVSEYYIYDVVCVYDTSNIKFYYNNGSNWVEINASNGFFESNEDRTEKYRLLNISNNDDINKTIYTIKNYSNTATSTAWFLYCAAELINSDKYAINGNEQDGYIFDGLTKVSNIKGMFYNAKMLTSIGGENNNKAFISYNEMNKLGEKASSVEAQRMFDSSNIQYLDYRSFVGSDGTIKIKITNADDMFRGATSFKGFIDSDNNSEYKYYISKNNDKISILPTTLTSTVRMFRNTSIECKENDVNGLLSGLEKVTNIAYMFADCPYIYSIANKPFKDLIKCENISGVFSNCKKLNIYNGNNVKFGMLLPYDENGFISGIDPFTLFDNTQQYPNILHAGGLFSNCESLTGHIYSGIFSTNIDGNKGAFNIINIGKDENSVKLVESDGCENTEGGAFYNTKINSYDVEFIQNLHNLTNVSALFAHAINGVIQMYSTDSYDIDSRYLALSGYYLDKEYHPGIYQDMFKYGDENYLPIENASSMFAGNKLLYLPEDFYSPIVEKYLKEDNKTTLLAIKLAEINDFNNTDTKINYPDPSSEILSSLFDGLSELKDASNMFAGTSIYYNPYNIKGSSSTNAVFSTKYEKLRMKDGIYIGNDLFKGLSELTDIRYMFAESVYSTHNNNQSAYIDDSLLKDCVNLKYVKGLFKNNILQKELPSVSIFNSCRNTLIDASEIFDGCINLSGEFDIGNNVPLVAYTNMLNDIKN